MIKVAEIKNFKNFSNFKLEDLKPITIIAGANNVGKTNLLEVLKIASNPGNLNSFIHFVQTRSKLIDKSYFEYFFKNPLEPIITRLELNDGNSVEGKFNLIKNGEDIGIRSELNGKKFTLTFQKVTSPLFPSPPGISLVEERFIPQHHPQPEENKISAVFTYGEFHLGAIDILENLLKAGYKEKILEIIQKILNTNVQDIFTISRPPSIYIKIENKILPLSFQGAGNIKLFMLLLINFDLYQKDRDKVRVILIDEIENGIHYSLKSKLCTFLCEISKTTQVIMTTHDDEFFASFFEVEDIEKYKDNLLYIRIDQAEEEFIPKYYDFDLLEYIAKKRKASLEEIWEIR